MTAPAVPHAHPPGPPPAPLSVLVIDDNQDCAQSTAELLAFCGHAVRTAASGEAAVAAAMAAAPDVVLVDIRMPGADGWAVAARLRGLAGGRRPFIVAVTGCATAADRERSAVAGIDLHLTKPADPAALIELLARVRDGLSTPGGGEGERDVNVARVLAVTADPPADQEAVAP